MATNPVQTLRKLKAALGGVADMERNLMGKREKLLQRIEELYQMPVSKEDALEYLGQVIDTGAAEFHDRLKQQLDATLANKNAMTGLPQTFPLFAPNSGQSWMTVTGPSLYGLLGPVIKSSLEKVIADMDWPEAGPSIAERQKEIEKINKELAKIESELAELQAAAKASGVELSGFAPKSKRDHAPKGVSYSGRTIGTVQ